jgi:HPt (histidine-containing phosphotransfer) domain-containing protein
MKLFNPNTTPQASILPDSPQEIDDRLKRRYLERLGQRVRRLRKLIIDRNWEDLRNECHQLATSGESFGFPHLTLLAKAAHQNIPQGKVSRATTPIQAKASLETLINAIDSTLIEHAVFRA